MDKRFDLIALGEGMVEFNQTQAGQRQYLQGFGGDTSNAVIAASRAGARCAYLSAVGDDAFGQLLMQKWQEALVDTHYVAIESGASTGLYFVSHGPQGHAFSYRRADSAATRMTLGPAQLQALAQTRWLHYSGISQAISARAREQCALAVQAARQAGAQISFDSNLRLRLWSLEEARHHLLQALQNCDLFLPSWDDITVLSGLDDAGAIVQWSHDHGARWVALKMGAQGVWVSDGQSQRQFAAHSVPLLDATGAGDCFAGNLLARLALGDDLFEAARYANAAAALSVQTFGAVDGLPSFTAVQHLLRLSAQA